MNKNIFSILTIFSALSLFSIGFSSWQIIDQSDHKSASIEDFSPVLDDIFSIDDIGITANTNIGKFTYYIDSSTNEYHFSSTDLTFSVTADKSKFEELEYDDTKKYYLELEIYYENSSGFDLFTISDYINAPEETEITLSDIVTSPLKTAVTASKNGDKYSLTTKIPVKSSTESSLYNLVYMYNNVDKNNNGKVYAELEIKLPFINPTDKLKNNFSSLKSMQLHTTLSVCKK